MSDPAQDEATTERRRPGRPRNVTPSPEYLRRRADIVETAAKVFQAKGYEAGSLDDVASALGLRKASLYYYVRSKAELLYLVFDRAIEISLQSLENLATAGTPAERLAGVVRHQVRTIASDPSLFSVFFDQRPHLDEDYVARIRAKERRYLQLFIGAVEPAIADKTLAVEDPRYAAQLLLGMTNWIYKWVEPGRDDIDAIADAAVRLVLGNPRARRTAR